VVDLIQEKDSTKIYPIMVGKSKGSGNNKKYYYYSHVVLDSGGWADPKCFLPKEYDICVLKTEKGIKVGWWCGSSWDGRLVKEGEVVLGWRRKEEVLIE
jgi:hypothetical protein